MDLLVDTPVTGHGLTIPWQGQVTKSFEVSFCVWPKQATKQDIWTIWIV